jgi:Fasciclin domain
LVKSNIKNFKMKNIKNNLRITCLAALSSLVFLSACNKELDQFPAIAVPANASGVGTIGRTITANPNDSLFNRLLIRSGLMPILNDSTKTFTIFAVDNAGMKIFVNQATSGFIPLSAADSNFSKFISGTFPVPAVNLSQSQATGIVAYNIIGQKYPSSAFPVVFPNYPITTQIQLDPVNSPFVRLPIFPAKGSPFSYVNNVPLTGVDQLASNGVIHHTFSIVAPPQATLKTLIAAKANLSYFRAAIARADSGAVGLGRLDSLLNYGILNITVLPPSDAAFQTLVFGLVYSQTLAATGSAAIALATANGAVAAGPNFLLSNNISTATVKGIIAYHFLATANAAGAFQPNIRVFSVNVPSTAAFVKTLVNGGVAAHPGVRAIATYTGPVATTVNFGGLGTFPPGGAPFSDAPASVIDKDNHGANGVFHIIDKVLLPQ